MVPSCANSSAIGFGKAVSYYRVPKSPTCCAKWFNACGVVENTVKDGKSLCSILLSVFI